MVDGSIEATGLEVAKAAQKILQNREIWQARIAKEKYGMKVNESQKYVKYVKRLTCFFLSKIVNTCVKAYMRT